MASMQYILKEIQRLLKEQVKLLYGLARRGKAPDYVLKETHRAVKTSQDLEGYEQIANGGVHPETKRITKRLARLRDIILERRKRAQT